MFQRTTLALSTCLLVLASCQKTVEWTDTDTGPANSSGTMVSRLVDVIGKDTTTTDYQYDAENRVLSYRQKAVSAGSVVHNFARFYRDAQGRIARIAQLSPSFPDTVYTHVHYNGNSSFNYTYKVTSFNLGGLTTTDSTVASYVNNRLSTEMMYVKLQALPDMLLGRMEYLYNATGSVASIRYFTPDQDGNLVLSAEMSMTYDDKQNPVYFGKDQVLVAGPGAVNNMLQLKFTDHTDAGSSFTAKYSYSYNALQTPSSAVYQVQPGTTQGKISYHYK